VALTLRLPSAWPKWSEVPAYWQTATWLVLFLLLSRLLYLPSSLDVAGTPHEAIEAPRNTSLVLEGVLRGDGPAVTLTFADFKSATLSSPRAELTESSSAMLAGFGATLPRGAGPHDLSWNVYLPPDAEPLPTPAILRIELAPAEGADLALGARNETLRLASQARLELSPVVQDFSAIGGWLKLDQQPTSAPADIMPQFVLVPGATQGEAEATLSLDTVDPEVLLGDPLESGGGLALRSIAHVDEAGRLIARYCGAPPGRLLFGALFQLRLEPQPPADACREGQLRASRILFNDGKIRAELGGSAYVPGSSELLDKLSGNIVLWPVLAALIAIPGQKLLAALLALFARKDKDSPPA
jgi:hypothetical protein